MKNGKNYVCYMLGIQNSTLEEALSKPKYHSFQVPKRSGGYRNISAPNSDLKVLQEKINRYIIRNYEFLDCQYGFVKGKSIVENANVHKKANYILNIDLKDFFPSIHFGRVRGIFMAHPFDLTSEVATILAKLSCYHNELPQGSPCSPSISNIVCYTLDKSLLGLSETYHFQYTRYADDITLSSDVPFSKEIVTRTSENHIIIGKKLRHIIESHGFRINDSKTNYSWNCERKEVTGLIVNEKVNTKKVYVKQLRAILDKARKDDLYRAAKQYFKIEGYDTKGNSQKTLIKEFRKVIEGKLNFLAMVRGKEDFVYQKYLSEYLTILHAHQIYSPSLRRKLIEQEEIE